MVALQLLECSRALLLPRLELSSSSSSLRRRAAVAPWAFTWESLNCWSCAGPYIACNVCCHFCYLKATFAPSVWWNRYSRNETNSGCDHFYALHSCGFCFEVILLHSEWSSCVLRPSIKMEENRGVISPAMFIPALSYHFSGTQLNSAAREELLHEAVAGIRALQMKKKSSIAKKDPLNNKEK